jgi:hypothetical protein
MKDTTLMLESEIDACPFLPDRINYLDDWYGHIDSIQSAALRAYPYIPKRSFYLVWIDALMSHRLELTKVERLRQRLVRFYGNEEMV